MLINLSKFYIAITKVRLRSTLEDLALGCSKYLALTKSSQSGAGSGKTKLDKERMKLCYREIVRSEILPFTSIF